MTTQREIKASKIGFDEYIKAIGTYNRIPKTVGRMVQKNPEKSLVSFAAEEAMLRAFPDLTKSMGNDVYFFDFHMGGMTLELKNKETASAPLPFHDAMIHGYSMERITADILVFTRIRRFNTTPIFPEGFSLKNRIKNCADVANLATAKYPLVYFVGWIEFEEFRRIAKRIRVGDWLPNANKRAEADSYNCTIEDLRPIDELKPLYREQIDLYRGKRK